MKTTIVRSGQIRDNEKTIIPIICGFRVLVLACLKCWVTSGSEGSVRR